MALNRSDKSRILRRYSPGMTRNSEMSTQPSVPPNLIWLESKPLVQKMAKHFLDAQASGNGESSCVVGLFCNQRPEDSPEPPSTIEHAPQMHIQV